MVSSKKSNQMTTEQYRYANSTLKSCDTGGEETSSGDGVSVVVEGDVKTQKKIKKVSTVSKVLN